jgi:hypothetical protein
MNALGCVLPNTPNATLTRLDSRRSGRSKTKERDSDRSGSMSHRIQASAEPDILRATPEMESKMQHHQHHHYHEEAGNKRRITADSWQPTTDESCCHLFVCAELVSWYSAMYGASEEESWNNRSPSVPLLEELFGESRKGKKTSLPQPFFSGRFCT